jgi:hypothetical protein
MSVSRRSLIALVLAWAPVADAATFTVNNTNSSGAGSLAQAILDANADDTPDVIDFYILGVGIKTISGNLPAITQPVTIDGYTQPFTTVNTLGGAETNANLRIALSGGALASTQNILDIQAGPTTIRGIIVNDVRSEGAGIAIANGVTGVSIQGCFIGTNSAGSIDDSSGIGILVDGTATIGTPDPADLNLISGADKSAILLRGPDSVVQNNLIGLSAAGAPNIPNGVGIQVSTASATGNTIGGSSESAGNVIAGNVNEGIVLLGTAGGGNQIEGNRIYANGGLGIDLGNDGVTANDDDDPDTGPNDLQNFPVLSEVSAGSGKILVSGSLDVPAARHDTEYRLSFFRSAECDETGHGEGELFLDALDVVVPDDEEFAVEIPVTVPKGEFLTATATDPETGDTSEFSECIEVDVGEPGPLCGDGSLDGSLTATDALIVLQVAVGSSTGDPCICDVNDNGTIQSSDALFVLRKAVDQPVTLDCPLCT